MNNKPENGFVLGKFLPPQNGHLYMCDFGQNYVEHLTILVCSLPNEPIPGELRFKWMQEMFPNCTVLWCNEILPQYPEEDPENFWQIWNDVIKRYHRKLYGEYVPPIDVVFASEPYGKRLAEDLNCQFVPVDIKRETVDISGTEVRNDPFYNWDNIPPTVRPYFVKRVCMFGPESSGKSTLARYLAKEFGTTMVPEYGRIYTEFFGAEVNDNDLQNIMRGHMASVAAAKKQANRILIEDTDPLLTAVWSDMLLGEGKRGEYLKEYTDFADLYILCGVDIPWVDDGTRYFPDKETRNKFYNLCKQELEKHNLNYIELSGPIGRRQLGAALAVEKLIS